MEEADKPISFTTTRTRSDLNWHFIYLCKRGFWKRIILVSLYMTAMFVGILAISGDIRSMNFSDWKYAALIPFAGLPAVLIFMYVVDYVLMAFMHRRMARQFTTQTMEISLDQETMSFNHEHGQASQKYDVLQKIHLHKHLIVMQSAYRLFYIIPWRDVPSEERDRLMNILTDVKARLKI